MLEPILCFTCGMSQVGDLFELFRHMRARAVADALGTTDAAQALIDPDFSQDCEAIFVALGVTNDCCRMTMATSLDFHDYYD
jgi:DNA-directed RNA polymerase subunit N (RpoN/RPB10)